MTAYLYLLDFELNQIRLLSVDGEAFESLWEWFDWNMPFNKDVIDVKFVNPWLAIKSIE